MKFLSFLFLSFLSFSVFATTPKEAFDLAKSGKGILIDVREADEIREGMIQNAQWFPLSRIETDTNWFKDFKNLTKDKKIFLYCRSGRRSEKVKNILQKNKIESENVGGYMDLKNKLPSVIP